MNARENLLKILDLARWAPSGDNTQPWRFEILSDTHVVVHGNDTRDWCVYDFEGHASHMAHGALLETLRIAATGFNLNARWTLREGTPDTAPIYDVQLSPEPGMAADPLLPYIESRAVQRRPMRTAPLTPVQRAALAAAPGPGFRVKFFETRGERWTLGRLLWRNAHIRLTCPEAYLVHREVIEWGARFSEDRIPEQAVGVDPVTARLMKWVMASWERVHFFNRYLFGTIAPRIQLDLIPAMSCAAHVLIIADKSPQGMNDYIAAGVAMQRLWLTCHASGLHLQPEMTPVIFAWYQRAGMPASKDPEVNRAISALAGQMKTLEGGADDGRAGAVVLARVGVSQPPKSRSLRLKLDALLRREKAG